MSFDEEPGGGVEFSPQEVARVQEMQIFVDEVRAALFKFMSGESDPFPALIEIYDALEKCEGVDIDHQGFQGRIRTWRWLGEAIATWISKGAQLTFYAKPMDSPKVLTAAGVLPESIQFVPALRIVWAHPFRVNPMTGEPMTFNVDTYGPDLFKRWEHVLKQMAIEVNTKAGADMPMLGPLDAESGLPMDRPVAGA